MTPGDHETARAQYLETFPQAPQRWLPIKFSVSLLSGRLWFVHLPERNLLQT